MLTARRIADGLRTLGIVDGDTLLVHSSIKSLGPLKHGPQTVVDGLREAVGPDGVIAVPTHTWATINAKLPVFDVRNTASHVGYLTNLIRQQPGAVRSLHPTHSVAAIGKGASAFTADHEIHDTPCSRTSPYGRLVEAHGKVLMLGVDLEYCTLFHGFEEWAEVPWCFAPDPEALVSLDERGKRIPVRSLRHSEAPGLGRNFPGLQHLLELAGAVTTGTIGQSNCIVLDAKKAADLLVPLLRQFPDLVLSLRDVPSPTLVGFGASSMQGTGDTEAGGFFNRLKPAVAGQALVNLGQGGDTTRRMLQRAGDVASHRPHDLVVLLGCNDYPRAHDANPAHRTAPREYVLNLTNLLNTIRGRRNIFITSFPADPIRKGIAMTDSATYVGLAKSAATNCGYGILDLFEVVRSAGLDFLADDGMHYSPAGHRFIAALVRAGYAAPNAPLTL